MVRSMAIFTSLIVVGTFSGFMDAKTSVGADEIAERLSTAISEYQKTVDDAAGKLVAAASAQKTLVSKKRLKVEEKLKLIELLEDDRKTFEKDKTTLPQSPLLKAAVDEYRKTLAAAKNKVLSAFAKAMNAYDAKGDLEGAKRVLKEKEELFKAGPPEIDPFKLGATWEGNRISRNPASRGENQSYKFEVTKRNGDHFDAKFWLIGKTENYWKITGKTSGDTFEYDEFGNGLYHMKYSGKAQGGDMSFQFKGKTANGSERYGDGALKRRP
jgi:hypothetical protein